MRWREVRTARGGAHNAKKNKARIRRVRVMCEKCPENGALLENNSYSAAGDLPIPHMASKPEAYLLRKFCAWYAKTHPRPDLAHNYI